RRSSTGPPRWRRSRGRSRRLARTPRRDRGARRRPPALLGGRAPPPLPPDRKAVREPFEALAGGTRLPSALQARAPPMHCHPEHPVIVDGELAFVGGIALTTLSGDRFDTSRHPARGAERYVYLGASSSGRPRSWRCSSRSSGSRVATSSDSSCCCRRSRTTG